MAKVRLVAFRRTFASSPTVFTSSEETTFELDLNEFPNISVNYQFSDIKNPETRKGSFSQTFKLPFTDNNNKFFENWYNYNNETQYFNTREKFAAAIYVGTVPQIEGYLQLKAVYKKGQYYEVVVFSNAADLFAVIGENSLKDVFKNIDEDLNNKIFNLDRQFLHANQLGFDHPRTGKRLEFSSNIPNDLYDILKKLRKLSK